MENVVMITFDVEAQAYQAFSQLKNDSVNSAYTILQMAVIKNGDGKIVPVDGFDSGIDSTDDTWTGGLIGSVVGILGGPLGVLLGGDLTAALPGVFSPAAAASYLVFTALYAPCVAAQAAMRQELGSRLGTLAAAAGSCAAAWCAAAVVYRIAILI